MKRTSVVMFVAIVMLAALTLVAAAGPAASAPAVMPDSPSATLFSYQGQVSDAAGNPITNPALPMTFKLYTVATGGTPCWTEAHTGGNAVAVTRGLFNVLLGQFTAIPSACLTGNAYLELVVNSETLSPRELLTSVLHAVEANTLPPGATTRGSLSVAGDLTVASGTTINGSGQSLVTTPQDVDISGTGALRFGSGTPWLGIDNNEITVFGDALHLQASGATTDVLVHTGLQVQGAGLFTRDKTGWMYGTHTLNVAESTFTTGNRADIGFHNQGASEGYIRLDAGPAGRKFLFGSEQTDMDGEFTGDLIVDGSSYLSGNLVMTGNNIYLGGNTGEQIVLRQDGDQRHLYIAPFGGPSSYYKQVVVGGGGQQVELSVSGSLHLGGTDFIMDEFGGRGGGRALVNDNNDILTINYDHDFTGGVRINGPVSCGALVESNLQTPAEQEAGGTERFTEGDVLCWGIDQLEFCITANDRLVQAVADKDGKPIIIGAEKVKVLGPVQRGDILVASKVSGYAMVQQRHRDPAV